MSIDPAFGWSYPPGVTGNEYEIAGPDWEDDIDVVCLEPNVTIKALADMGNATLKDNLIEVYLDKCPFEGVVQAQGFRGRTWWTCPLCAAEHDDNDN